MNILSLQMPLSEGVAKRRGHTATVLKISDARVIVVLVGGVSDWIPNHKCWEQTMRPDTQILELELGNNLSIIYTPLFNITIH